MVKSTGSCLSSRFLNHECPHCHCSPDLECQCANCYHLHRLLGRVLRKWGPPEELGQQELAVAHSCACQQMARGSQRHRQACTWFESTQHQLPTATLCGFANALAAAAQSTVAAHPRSLTTSWF